MKVLLTGAAGKLGSAAFKELLDAGFEVKATDISRRPELPGKVKVGDLLSREFCYDLVEDVSLVIHVANHPNAWAGSAQKVFNENVTMNMNVFQAAVESGVKKIIYASSVQAINGNRQPASPIQTSPHPYLPLDGEIPQNPANPYALSKCAGEQQLQYLTRYHSLSSAVAVRFPMLMARSWFAEWRSHSQKPPSIHPHTWLEEAFTWLSVTDAARLLVAAAKTDLPGCRCYFPAHPTPRINMTIREIVEKFFANVPLRKPMEQMAGIVDISRITAETGWSPIENFRDP